MASIPGVDVSEYQGQPDWAAVHNAGYAWAYIKATEGIGYVSKELDGQLQGARGAGLVTGLYHFARPDTGNTPQQDAQDFAAQLARLGASGPGNLPPCLDFEKTASDPAAWIKGFIDAIRQQTGRQEVMVYASASSFEDTLNPSAWVDPAVWLWVAHYGPPAGQPGYHTDRVVMHQYADNGQVPGIGGQSDLDVSMVDLPVLTGAAAPTPPPPGETYVVQPGDTLSGIGQKLGVDWHQIAAANGITDPNVIYPGQVLRIPRQQNVLKRGAQWVLHRLQDALPMKRHP
jgi:lysozyme